MKVKEQKERMCKVVTDVGRRLGVVPQCVCNLSDDTELFGDNIIPLELLEDLVGGGWDSMRKKEKLWDSMIQAIRKSELCLRWLVEQMHEKEGSPLRVALKDCQTILKEVDK